MQMHEIGTVSEENKRNTTWVNELSLFVIEG